MKIQQDERTAQALISKLIDAGMNKTKIARLAETSVTTICRAHLGQYDDVEYQLGIRLENLVKSTKAKKS